MPTTPTDATKAQVWITGTAPNQQFEFYIPRGAKGETGGVAQINPGDVNLNTLTQPGIYTLAASGSATTANNYPYVGATGALSVMARDTGNARLVQVLYPNTGSTYAHNTVYIRARTSGDVWQPWRVIPTQRIDNSAGRAIYTWDEANTREQLVWGDTGWRDIKALTINGWTSTSLLIRRVGSNVSLVGNITATAATGDHFLPLQVGFAPTAGNYHGVASSNAVPPVFRPLGTDSVNHYVTSGGTSGTYHIQGNFMTVSAWPTTLPGTASGAIPNL